AACYSLDVTAVQPGTGTSFTREQVLADPTLMEKVVGGLFVNLWGGITYQQPWLEYAIYGEELTTSENSCCTFNGAQSTPIWDDTQEPRTEFDNSLSGISQMARNPWSNFYEANAAATDMPRLIHQNHLTIINKQTGEDETQRTLIFAKFIQGMA